MPFPKKSAGCRLFPNMPFKISLPHCRCGIPRASTAAASGSNPRHAPAGALCQPAGQAAHPGPGCGWAGGAVGHCPRQSHPPLRPGVHSRSSCILCAKLKQSRKDGMNEQIHIRMVYKDDWPGGVAWSHPRLSDHSNFFLPSSHARSFPPTEASLPVMDQSLFMLPDFIWKLYVKVAGSAACRDSKLA